VYSLGYDTFTLATLCDGYICQARLSDYEGVTPIDEFVSGSNLGDARAQSPDPRFRTASVEDFYQEAATTADIRRRMPR
jgi:hypothetical protein